MDKIAVLIPCYNEEKTIEKVVRCTFLSCLLFGNGVFDNRSAAEILDKLL